jgi:hypothetical protein
MSVIALVYTCTVGELWPHARFAIRSRVACWMLRRKERQSMATPSAIVLEFENVDPTIAERSRFTYTL